MSEDWTPYISRRMTYTGGATFLEVKMEDDLRPDILKVYTEVTRLADGDVPRVWSIMARALMDKMEEKRAAGEPLDLPPLDTA